MKNCPNCNVPNADNAAFCENCGAPLTAAQENLFEQEQAAEAFDLEQPAPKKKKTGLIVGVCAAVCVAAAGVVAAVMLLGGSPAKKLDKAVEKTFAALPAASAETPNLEKTMENLKAIQESKKSSVQLNAKVDMNQDYGDGDPFANSLTYSITVDADQNNKIASGSFAVETAGEKINVQASADDEKIMVALPDYLDTAVSFRTKELGQDLKHLSDIGLFEYDESMADMSLDLFPDEDGTSAWDFNAFVERIQTECAEEVKAVEESYTVGKGSASTVSFGGTDINCTAYPVEASVDAVSAVYEKLFQICLDECVKYMQNTSWVMSSGVNLLDMNNAEMEDEFRTAMQEEIDVFLDAMRQLDEQNFQMTFYVKDGYFVGFDGSTDTVDVIFLLLGEENPWNDFVLKGTGNSETVFELRGGLTNENGANKFSLDIADTGKLELTYTDSTGAYSLAAYEGEEETFALTGAIKPVGTGVNVTAAVSVENEGSYGSYSYSSTTDVSFDMTIDVLTETPKHIAENALALGEATEEELYALVMQLMYQ